MKSTSYEPILSQKYENGHCVKIGDFPMSDISGSDLHGSTDTREGSWAEKHFPGIHRQAATKVGLISDVNRMYYSYLPCLKRATKRPWTQGRPPDCPACQSNSMPCTAIDLNASTSEENVITLSVWREKRTCLFTGSSSLASGAVIFLHAARYRVYDSWTKRETRSISWNWVTKTFQLHIKKRSQSSHFSLCFKVT